jgi:hypothetical protein
LSMLRAINVGKYSGNASGSREADPWVCDFQNSER